MTSEHPLNPTKRFVPALLPWLLAAGFLVVYLLTLNHWVTFGSLGQVARVSGWTWQAEATQPLTWLITSAFHILPPKLIPLGLNLFSALCAVLCLAQLARSVALLPHDRTEDQRSREKGAFSLLSIPMAWLPVLLATLLCGLQLTFWEHATASSGEMLDLLLFAYIVRCLLEFRIDERDAWLYRAALLYGLAMPENWAMIGFFPLFLVALIWLKGLNFFNVTFLSRMFALGSAGLLLYLLLPLANTLSGNSSFSFWQILKANLDVQRYYLFRFAFNKYAILHGDQPLWVLGVPALLPVLVMGIRWPSYFGDPSKLGVTLTTLIFHLFHAFLLCVCTWVALDPAVSPRHLVPELPMLPFYYLGALSVGYYSGYFLLVFRQKSGPRMRPSPLLRYVNMAAASGVWLLFLVATALLLYRNVPEIRLLNGPVLRDYAALQTSHLPERNTVVLSDDARALYLVQSATTQAGSNRRYIFLDTGSLPLPDYHRFLKQKYPQRWLAPPPKDRTHLVTDIGLIQILVDLGKTNEICYLHPSFGYYFEVFYPEAHGLVYQLKQHLLNTLLPPTPSNQLLAENEDFWTNSASAAFQPLVNALAPVQPGTQSPFPESLLKTLATRLHLPNNQNPEAAMLGDYYSRALDYWGVQLQKTGHLPEASDRFAQALALNPDNLAAAANQEVNAELQTGRKLSILEGKALEERFGKYHSLEPLMRENGPYDDPTFCALQGGVFFAGGNIRQGAELLARTKALVPNHFPTSLRLASAYNQAGSPDQALGIIQEIHTNSELFAASQSNAPAVLFIETSAYAAKNDTAGVTAAIRTALERNPNDKAILAIATKAYRGLGLYSNALGTVEQELHLSPDNEVYLTDKGLVCNQLGTYDQAIEALTKALKADTNSDSELFATALLGRGTAYLRSGQLDAAQRDFEALQKNYPTAWQTYWGLGEVAYHKKDTNAAVRNYQLCLTNSPPDNTETNLVVARLKELKPGPP